MKIILFFIVCVGSGAFLGGFGYILARKGGEILLESLKDNEGGVSIYAILFILLGFICSALGVGIVFTSIESIDLIFN